MNNHSSQDEQSLAQTTTKLDMFLKMLTIPLVAFTFYLPAVAALSLNSGADSAIFGRHSARQLPTNVPQACQQYCGPVDEANRNKCPESQCCNNDFAIEYQNCFLCVGNAIKQSDWSIPQMTYNAYVDGCKYSGYTVPSFTFSGQSVNDGSSTAPQSTSSNPSTSTNASSSSNPSTTSSTASNSHSTGSVRPTTTAPATGATTTSAPTQSSSASSALTWKNRDGYVSWMGAAMVAVLAGSYLG